MQGKAMHTLVMVPAMMSCSLPVAFTAVTNSGLMTAATSLARNCSSTVASLKYERVRKPEGRGWVGERPRDDRRTHLSDFEARCEAHAGGPPPFRAYIFPSRLHQPGGPRMIWLGERRFDLFLLVGCELSTCRRRACYPRVDRFYTMI
jgi:hypothetical protein